MLTIGERNFHLLMGAVFFVAVLGENLMPKLVPTWNPPQLGFLAFIVGLVWVGRYAAWRNQLRTERDLVLAERVDRLERAQRALEDDLRDRFRRPL